MRLRGLQFVIALLPAGVLLPALMTRDLLAGLPLSITVVVPLLAVGAIALARTWRSART